jgi:hypothetical protein
MRYGLGFWLHRSNDVVILEGSDAGVSFRSVHDPARAITHTVISNTADGAWPMSGNMMSGNIFLLRGEDELVPMVETPYDSSIRGQRRRAPAWREWLAGFLHPVKPDGPVEALQLLFASSAKRSSLARSPSSSEKSS